MGFYRAISASDANNPPARGYIAVYRDPNIYFHFSGETSFGDKEGKMTIYGYGLRWNILYESRQDFST